MAVAIRSDAPFAARLGLGQGRRDDGAFLVQHDRIGVLALFFQMLQLVARLVFQTLGVFLFRIRERFDSVDMQAMDAFREGRRK